VNLPISIGSGIMNTYDGRGLIWSSMSKEEQDELRQTDLRRRDLSEADLRNADFRSVDLRRADLRNAILSGANLTEANLVGANLRNAILSGIVLSRANLRNADLSWANLEDANLRNTDLSDANLTWADFSDANLTWADLSGASLRNTDLSNAILSNTILRNTNLSGAKGLLNPIDYLLSTFARTDEGLIVYKTFGMLFQPDSKWQIEEGSIIEEECHSDRTLDCACGVNFATLEWLVRHKVSTVWECLIKWEWLSGVVVPYNTDGKCRCARLQLVKEIKGNYGGSTHAQSWSV